MNIERFVGAGQQVSTANSCQQCANKWQHDPNDAGALSTSNDGEGRDRP
jgi:hypothetical protein